MNNFSAGACIRYGWETFKKRAWFFIGAFFLLGVVEWFLSAVSNQMQQNGGILYALTYIAVIILSTLLDMGMNAFLLKSHDALGTVTIQDLWHPQPFWKFIFAALLSGIVIGVGFILLIVPGIILALMLMFVKVSVIDRNLGPIEAMKESARITSGHKWQLFVLALAILGLNIVGAICLIIGLLITAPISALAMVHAYRTLQGKAGATPQAA